MTTYPLEFLDGHLFLLLDGERWLLDTGAPTSFGSAGDLILCGQQFGLEEDYLGLDAEALTGFVGVPCVGLLGTDVLGGFDHNIDVPRGELRMDSEELPGNGELIPLDAFMGIPIVTVDIGGRANRMFFDTGAQISYYQDPGLESYPPAGDLDDFYPGAGAFRTSTFHVAATIGTTLLTLRCGRLPGLLGATLMMAGTQGIIGNELVRERTVAWFPRRGVLVL